MKSLSDSRFIRAGAYKIERVQNPAVDPHPFTAPHSGHEATPRQILVKRSSFPSHLKTNSFFCRILPVSFQPIAKSSSGLIWL
jgi:hypothetical protein